MDAVSTVDLVRGVRVSVDGAPGGSLATSHQLARGDLPQ